MFQPTACNLSQQLATACSRLQLVDRCGTSVCIRSKCADMRKLLNQTAERRNCSLRTATGSHAFSHPSHGSLLSSCSRLWGCVLSACFTFKAALSLAGKMLAAWFVGGADLARLQILVELTSGQARATRWKTCARTCPVPLAPSPERSRSTPPPQRWLPMKAQLRPSAHSVP